MGVDRRGKEQITLSQTKLLDTRISRSMLIL